MTDNLFPYIDPELARKRLVNARARRKEKDEQKRAFLLKAASEIDARQAAHVAYSGSTEEFLSTFEVNTVRIAQSINQAMAVQFLAKKWGWTVSRTNLKDGRFALSRIL